jgi:hypothetical protein
MEMLLFTSGSDSENYSNICDFGDVNILVTIWYAIPYVSLNKSHSERSLCFEVQSSHWWHWD